MRINAAMRDEMSKLLMPNAALPKLSELVSGGFQTKKGCFFLSRKYQPHYDEYEIEDFHDETGFEAFVNSVDFESLQSQDQLAESLVFCREIMQVFQDIAPKQTLLTLVMKDETNVRVKFYVQRAGQNYLSGEIEDYKEAVMELSGIGLDELLTT